VNIASDTSPSGNICRICGAADAETFVGREMMFGTREAFAYFRCRACGCLQIAEFPANIADYYPQGYYSFQAARKRKGGFSRWRRILRRRYAIERKGVLGGLLYLAKKPNNLICMLGDLRVRISDRLLDVGCGGGNHVLDLLELGMTGARGIDRFIAADIVVDGRTIIHKGDVLDLRGEYDLITFHHSFEHVDNPRAVLQKSRELLARGGRILIRIPCVDSFAWEEYGTDWVQMDPPRHFFLHSHASVRRLAEDAGLVVENLWCDSDRFQFTGSEKYRRDIPLTAEGAGDDKIFTGAEIAAFDERARRLNAEGRGDQICVVLRAAPSGEDARP